MEVLITGVAGFIGSHIAEALLEDGANVYGIDDLSTGRARNIPAGVAFFEGDIRDTHSFEAFSDVKWDVIYHCAASYKDRTAWERDASVNVLGTINVVREAQRTGSRLVYFQTSLCYGQNPMSPVRIDHELAPSGSYAVSKTAGERYISDSGVDYVSLRLANMFGPRNLSGPVPNFFKRLSEGERCTVVESRRDFVYVGDLVRVAVDAATKGHGPYHVASGSDRSIIDLYRVVLKAMLAEGMTIEPETPIVIPRGADDVETILLDPSKTAAEFDWAVEVPFEAGVRNAVKWYREHGVTETYTHLAVKG